MRFKKKEKTASTADDEEIIDNIINKKSKLEKFEEKFYSLEINS